MKALRLKMHHFHTKLPYQKPMLRPIEWWVQNGPTPKSFASNYSIFFKILFQCKNLLWRVDLTCQRPKCFEHFLSTGALFKDTYSLLISLNSRYLLNSTSSLNHSSTKIIPNALVCHWFSSHGFTQKDCYVTFLPG